MDPTILIAIKILFIVAALAPLVLVIRYRWVEVPIRHVEISKAFGAAFTDGDESARATAQKALNDNPYVSNSKSTFNRIHSVKRYVLPLIVLAAVTGSSTYMGYSWVVNRLAAPVGTPPPGDLPTVVIMALAGGLLWALYQIIKRTGSSELVPSDLYEIDLGVLAAVPIGYAFSLVTQELDGVRSFMAFAAALFPVRDALRLAREQATRRMLDSKGTQPPRPAERHLGTAIDGVSDEALARLGELRIFTALDMAYSDPVRIMVQTGYPLPVIIDWMDQAIWSLYAGETKGEWNKQGIRCSLDVCEFVDLHLRDDKGQKLDKLDALDQAAVDALASKVGTTRELLPDLLFRISNDPQVAVLRELWYPGGVPPDLRRKRQR